MNNVKILNENDTVGVGSKMAALDMSQSLQKAMLRMTGKYMNEKSGLVNYKDLKKSHEYEEYRTLASNLRHVELADLQSDEHTAFFINLYNALTIDSITQLKTEPGSTLDVTDFWSNFAYKIGPYSFTLDQIEHGILRGNGIHPATSKPVLEIDDPRLAYTSKSPDARIHFALNCGAKSCPMVKVYNADNLDFGLESSASSYLGQEVEVKDGILKLPQILEWYMTDFAPNLKGMLRWICKYVGEKAREAINKMLSDNDDDEGERSEKMPVDFFYDWSLNSI